MASAMLSKLTRIKSLKLTHLRSPSRQFVCGFLLGIGFSLILLAVLFVSENPTTEEQQFITVGVNPLCGDSCSSSDDAIASKMLDSVPNDHVIAREGSSGKEPVQVVSTTEPVLQQLVNTTEPVLVETGLNITEQAKDETIAAEEENAASKDLDADNSVVQVAQEESVPTKDGNSSLNAEVEGEALGTAYLPNSSVAYQLPSWVVKYFGKALPPFSVSVKEALPPLGVSVREEALPRFGLPIEEALPPVHAEEKVEMIESIVSKNSTIVDDKLTKKETAVRERPGNSKEKITDYGFPRVFGKQSDPAQKCDIYQGKWVKDKSMPFYPGGSCSLIDENFDCYGNGRPDTDFLKWRWQPFGCKIPRLNPIDFLERLRGKRLVYMGDSLNRNMWESMVCILRHGVQDKNKVYEVSGRREFKKRGPGMYSFIFEEYNCSVDFVWSPFLVSKSTFPGKNTSFETLKLDLMDPSAAKIQDADIIVFNTALWWVHFKTKSGINFYQEGNRVYPRLKAHEAYKRALKTWASWVDNNINVNRTRIFFRGMTSTHYGGRKTRAERYCNKQIKLITRERYLSKYSLKMRMVENVLHGMNTPVTYINISRLTNYRRDGHSAIYRKKHKTKEEELAETADCTHWCLPGVPDTWNELLYASLLHPEWGSSI